MLLSNYDFDAEYRWWTFFCDCCDITVNISESISQDIRESYEKDDGLKLDPLTDEEQKLFDRKVILNKLREESKFDPDIQEELK
jgi:hypothetical protein